MVFGTKQALFRKEKISSYDVIETMNSNKWPGTLIDCSGFCLRAPECHGVLFKKGQTCTTIKNIIPGGNEAEAWILDSLQAQPKEDCYRYKWAYGYHDVPKNMKTTGPEECQVKCQQDDRCYHWSYYGSNSKCYLKKATALQGGAYVSHGVAGPKNCPLVSDTYEKKDCFLHQVSYPGCGDIGKKFTVSGEGKCQEKCQNESRCKNWTYYVDKLVGGANCYLKDQNAPTCGKYSAITISGPKTCP